MIDGLELEMPAYFIDALGDTEFGQLDVIVGALTVGPLTMEEWRIKLYRRSDEQDLSTLRNREFTEFAIW